VVERHTGPSQLKTGEAPRVKAVFGDAYRPGGEDRFAVVKIRFELPPGAPYYRTSKAFPELVAEVTAASHLPNGLDRVEMDIVGSPSTESLEFLRHEPGVVSVSRVAALGPLTRNHMVAQTPPFHLLEKELAILVRYPIVVRNGTYTLEAAGRVSQLQAMIKKLREFYQGVEVLRFGPDRMRTVPDSLTPQQDALLHLALAAGYFDVPRRVTLTGLAKKLGKSKSSLSRGLAIVEQKLAESVVATTR
jgi:predicted DNA binding protein